MHHFANPIGPLNGFMNDYESHSMVTFLQKIKIDKE